MKNLTITFLLFLFPLLSFCQTADFSIGYTSEKMMSFDIGIITKTNRVLYIEFCTTANKGTVGKYYETINWDQFKEDNKSYGTFYSIYNVGYGYKKKNFAFIGLLGYADKSAYLNKYDNLHILGNNGAYYVVGRLPEDRMNIGGIIKYFADFGNGRSFLSIGAKYTLVEGGGLTLGIAF